MKRLIPFVIIFSLTLIYFGCRKDEDPVPVIDTTPPTSVENVTGELVLNKDKTIIDTLKLSWESSVDASGVVKYKVDLLMYDENGVPKKIRTIESNEPKASFVTLSNSKDYKVEVQTLDASGNASPTVLKDLNENKNPITSTIDKNNLTLSWPAPAGVDASKIEYEINLFEASGDNLDQLIEIISENPELNHFIYEKYDELKTYMAKVIIKNKESNTTETKEINVQSSNTTKTVTELNFSKKLDPNNIKIIDELIIKWNHQKIESAQETEFTVDLFMFDENGQNPKKIRTEKANTDTVTFKTISNTRKYEVVVIALDKKEGINFNPSPETSVIVEPLASTKTRPITGLSYSHKDGTNGTDLTLTWNHDTHSSTAVMQYTLKLFEYDASGLPVFVKEVKADQKNHTFSGLYKDKSYRVTIIASNIETSKVYTPSEEVVVKIERNNATTGNGILPDLKDLNYIFKFVQNNPWNNIEEIKIEWNLDNSISANATFNCELHMDGKVIRTVSTKESFCAFNTLSRNKTYSATVTVSNQNDSKTYRIDEIKALIAPPLKLSTEEIIYNDVDASIIFNWKEMTSYDGTEYRYLFSTGGNEYIATTNTIQIDNLKPGIHSISYRPIDKHHNTYIAQSHVFEILPFDTLNRELKLFSQTDLKPYKGHKIKTLNGSISVHSSPGWTPTTKNGLHYSFPPVHSLSNLNGFEIIKGSIILNYHYQNLKEMAGFDKLKEITGDIRPVKNFKGDLSTFSKLERIGGDLILDGGESLNGLQNLKNIGGSLILENTSIVTMKHLTNLESIGGDLIINNNSLLNIFELPKIKSIGGVIKINNNKGIVNFDLKNETEITSINSFEFINNSSLQIIKIPLITSFNNLKVNANPQLTKLSIHDGITNIKGTVSLFENPLFSELENFNGIKSIGGLNFYQTPLSPQTSFDQLETINGNISFNYCNISDIPDFGRLTTIQNKLFIANCNITELKSFDSLLSAGGIQIEYEKNLSSINTFYNLKSIGYEGLLIQQNQYLNGYNQSFQKVTSAKYITIRSNPSLNAINFESLESIENMSIQGINYTTLNGFNNLKSAKQITISESPKLISIDGFNNLVNTSIKLLINKNSSLTSINGFQLLEVSGNLEIKENPNLSTINGLNNLKNINSLDVNNNPKLTSPNGLNNIQTISNHLFIINNDSLNNLDFLQNLVLIKCGSTNGNTLRIEGNFGLRNLCGLQKLFSSSDGFCSKNYNISDNAFNPNHLDISLGECSK